MAAAHRAVGADQGHRFGVGQSGPDRRRAEAGKHRQRDAAQPRQREEGDGDFGRHRQVDADRGAAHQADRLEPRGEANHLFGELGVRQSAHGAVLAFPDDGFVLAAPGFEMPLEQALGHVRGGADAPLRPGEAVGQIEHPRVRASEADLQVTQQRVLEPLGLFASAAFELGLVGDPRGAHEALPVGRASKGLARLPHPAVRCAATGPAHRGDPRAGSSTSQATTSAMCGAMKAFICWCTGETW